MARTNKRIKKKKTIYLACEGGDVGTEARYIIALCEKYNCTYIPISKQSLDPKTLAQTAIDFVNRTTKLSPSEVWIVFDNDEPLKVKEAFNLIKNHNNNLKRGSVHISIAFNAPSVEVWGLLCCGVKKIPETKEKCQSDLHACMPKYIHKKRSNMSAAPRFDFDITEQGCDAAIKIAQAWETSIVDQEEYSVSPYAGIFKLVKSIKD